MGGCVSQATILTSKLHVFDHLKDIGECIEYRYKRVHQHAMGLLFKGLIFYKPTRTCIMMWWL